VNETMIRQEIRDELLRAVEADVSRARPRRRRPRPWVVGTAAIVSVAAAGTVGAAAGVGPLRFSGPLASDFAQSQFNGMNGRDLPGGPLRVGTGVEVARAGDRVLYAAGTDDGGYCLSTDAGLHSCVPGSAQVPPIFTSLSATSRTVGVPGKPDRPFSAWVIGRTTVTGAVRVEIDTVPDQPSLRAEVGRHGFFLLDYPESTYAATGQSVEGRDVAGPTLPPIAGARAYDAAGNVVAAN
jgi:hypothetical protein